MPDKIEKQAIVVIHGMGEQRPILTLRGFVEPIARYLRDVLKQALIQANNKQQPWYQQAVDFFRPQMEAMKKYHENKNA